MHHHRGVATVERTLPCHDLLAAEAFLCRRAEVADAAGKPRAELGERDGSAKSAGRDDVVAAGVADAGQGVVFGEDRDVWTGVLAELGDIAGDEAERFA